MKLISSLQIFLTVALIVIRENCYTSIIKIGAIFPKSEINGAIELAFKYAVYRINQNNVLLSDSTLVYNIQYVDKFDSFHACKKVCKQLRFGTQAIFGPSITPLSYHVNSICNALDIPHIEARMNVDTNRKEFSINLFPRLDYINDAVLDLIKYFNWTKVAILHDNNGLIQLSRLSNTALEIHVRCVNPYNYDTILNEMKVKEIFNIIIDTSDDYIPMILKSILHLQMNEYKYHYFLTSFDIEVFDLEDFKYNYLNITAFRLIDFTDVDIKTIIKDMKLFQIELMETFDTTKHDNTIANAASNLTLHNLKTMAALVYDSVYVLAIGLQTLQQSLSLYNISVSCEDEQTWKEGLSLINYINVMEWIGLTGPIFFKEGSRVQFKLDVVKLKKHSIAKFGEWSPRTRLNITESSAFFDTATMNGTLVVMTILETPYVMMHYGKNFTGNERFYGFCVDVLDLLAQSVGFEFILDLVPDRKYGVENPQTGEWNGMIAQLMKYKADLAIGSITITHARESVIDFTKPFMTLGISILFKVPSASPRKLFAFMNPLGLDIWLYVLAAYITVSLIIYLMAKVSLVQQKTTTKCEICHCIACMNSDAAQSNELNFDLKNSFWYTIGTLMQQTSDAMPKSIAIRLISIIWWFFSLIIITSYTANLAAFLTVERMSTPIENADDLASQTDISYGTLESGSTMTFFRDSQFETYQKMWRNMNNAKKPNAFTSTYEEGIRRVKESNYAFLMESTMLDYVVQRDCNLSQIGGLLDTKGYGIATPKGSPWRDKMSLAILELQEKGEIQILYDKWWKNTAKTCDYNRNEEISKGSTLGLESIGGIFVVLLIGVLFASLVAVYEFWIEYSKSNSLNVETHNNRFEAICYNDNMDYNYYSLAKRPFLSELFNELGYAIRCMQQQQRPAFKRHVMQLHNMTFN